MVTSLMTVLGVEGDVYYTACSVCSTKVDLTPSNRGWCRRCGVRTHSPNIRYRLSLRVSEQSVPTHITIFGYHADKLFGCSVSNFLRKVRELKLSDEQVISAVQRSLLSEVIKVTRSDKGTVMDAVFAVENSSNTIIDKLQTLDSSTGSHYSPLPKYRNTGHTPNFTDSPLVRTDKLQSLPVSETPSDNVVNKGHKSSLVAKEHNSLLRKATKNNEQTSRFMSPSNGLCKNPVQNSTPLFSQLSLGAMKSEELSPILLDSFSPFSNRNTAKGDDSNHRVGTHSTIGLLRLGKRRRCRVQKIVQIPPTQNASFSDTNGIDPPDSSQSDNEKCSFLQTKSSSSKDENEISPGCEAPGIFKPFVDDDIDIIVDLMKSDDFSLFDDEDKENINNINSCGQISHKDDTQNSKSDVTNSLDFDSFDVDQLSLPENISTSAKSESDIGVNIKNDTTASGNSFTTGFKVTSPNSTSHSNSSTADLFGNSTGSQTQLFSQLEFSVNNKIEVTSPSMPDRSLGNPAFDWTDQGGESVSDCSAELF